MRALLITKDGIRETAIGPEVERLRAVVENRTKPTGDNLTLKSMYRLMECDTVTGAGYPNQSHACWADDDGAFKITEGTQVTRTNWFGQELVGTLLVTGFDPKTGDTTAATMTVEELESMIQIGEIRYA